MGFYYEEESETAQICPGCGKGCSLDAPSCGRGFQYAEDVENGIGIPQVSRDCGHGHGHVHEHGREQGREHGHSEGSIDFDTKLYKKFVHCSELLQSRVQEGTASADLFAILSEEDKRSLIRIVSALTR